MRRFSRSVCSIVLVFWATSAWCQPPSSAASDWSGTTEQKIWGLMTVWAHVKYTFPHFNRMATMDWDQRVQGYIPRSIAAEDKDSYYQLLSELVAQLHDGTLSFFRPGGTSSPAMIWRRSKCES